MATKRPLDSFALRDIFQDIEKDLIASMKRNLAKHTAEEQALGFSWEQWQKAKLRAIGAYRVANRLILNDFKPDIQNAIDQVLKESYTQDYSDSIKLADDIDLMFSGMDRSGVLGQIPPDESNFFRINDPKLNTMIQEMQRDFSNTDGLVLRKMDDVYRQTITKSALELTSGSTSIQSAIDHATEDFLAKGIDCINYKNGSRVNIASYAEMYLRTASRKAGLLADGKFRDERGIYTVLSSIHVNCCEHCLTWQGKVMIDDEFTSLRPAQAQEISRATGYQLLSTAMKDLFLHPNCRHTLSTYYPGKSTLPKALTQAQADQALENYNLEQQQRKLESELRKWKRIREGSMSPEQLITADRMVKFYQQQLRDHIRDHPEFRRNYWRERAEPMTGASLQQLVGRKVNVGTLLSISKALPQDIKISEIPHIRTDRFSVGSIGDKLDDKMITRRVTVTGERLDHILKSHPDAGELLGQQVSETITNPTKWAPDKRHTDSLLIARELDDTYSLVVAVRKLTDQNDLILGKTNTIITAMINRNKRLKGFIDIVSVK